MEKESPSRKSRYIFTSSEVGFHPMKVIEDANHAFDKHGAYLRVISLPPKERQSDYTHGEGPGLISKSQVLIEIDVDILFNFLYAQVAIERILPKFPQIAGFVGVENNVAMFSKPLTSVVRGKITDHLVGAYSRPNVYFCATDQIEKQDLGKVLQSILIRRQGLPYGWEIAQSNGQYEPSWSTHLTANLRLRK